MNAKNLNNRSCRIVVLSGVFILAVLLSACKPFSPDEKEPDRTGMPIEGSILFSLREGYAKIGEVADPEIILSMATQSIYGCCNYSIVARTCFDGATFEVNLQGIYIPDICLTALGPATFRRPVNLPTGTFEFIISSADTIDRYEVTITETSISLQAIETRFTIPRSTLVWRYPENSFACVCGTMEETAWICGDFADSLLAMPNLQSFVFPDSGTVPYPTESSGHWHDDPARYYLYENESDYDAAGELLRRYSLETIAQYSGVTIYLVNYRNKWFRSWQFIQKQ